ncbi:hypothetical protein CES85_0245 [Ochrobactrum quorumnocens]|uniref:Uncharacterized protein n=1 Tax=Ochrobactrum quorumnocens TaxID=271865 RepID=A0A248UKS1_9HYPH|nr:hypothetical protein CES85_0245 [[Ochrobactrum] quorumnocens]
MGAPIFAMSRNGANVVFVTSFDASLLSVSRASQYKYHQRFFMCCMGA